MEWVTGKFGARSQLLSQDKCVARRRFCAALAQDRVRRGGRSVLPDLDGGFRAVDALQRDQRGLCIPAEIGHSDRISKNADAG